MKGIRFCQRFRYSELKIKYSAHFESLRTLVDPSQLPDCIMVEKRRYTPKG